MYNFAITITLGLHLLLCQGVSSSLYSVLENQTSRLKKTDNNLGEFLAEFNNAYLKKYEPRHFTIIGASTEQLRQLQDSIIASHPHIICTDPGICVYPRVFDSGSFFIIFLGHLDDKTVEKNLKMITGRRSSWKFLFVFEGIGIKNNEISSFLIRIAIQGMVYPELLHVDKDAVKLYLPWLEQDCSLGIKLKLVWKPGTDLNKIDFSNSLIPDMKGCPFSVGSFEYKPHMMIEKRENGSLVIAGGYDGMLVLLIAEKLNFTVALKYPSKLNVEDKSMKSALLEEVISGITAFGISRSLPNNTSAMMSNAFDNECLTWAVPRIVGSTENLIWTEFTWEVWLLIGSVFVISCVVGYANQTIISSRNTTRQGVGIATIMLDVVSINLAYPVLREPVSMGGKLMLIASLYYALVTTTAYKSSFASILSAVRSPLPITDPSGIVDANLNTVGSAYHYKFLKEQESSSEVAAELMKRYVIDANESAGLHRVAYDKNFALLARRSSLDYRKHMTVEADRLIRFDILNECVLKYPTVIVFRKGSLLVTPVNKVITRVVESGILRYWDQFNHIDDNILEQKNAERFSALYIRKKYWNIFILYIGCIIVCILVFFIEILTAKFGSKKLDKKTQPSVRRTYRFKRN